eukprot:GEMP01023113.1.p1 GENE.GEMP01023113.1~~GEMP01023113.1.p1  ORF type:complete len:645 (+),score=190.48 GEMP01023113.1:250-2184(+)
MENANITYESGCAVSTFAGTGQEGHHDGTKSEAQFDWPISVATDKHGDMYVADYVNNQLRKINVADGSVCTVAGTGTVGSKDGSGHEAQFDHPWGVAVGTNGNILVTELRGNRIRAFSSATNMVRTIVGTEARLSKPRGIAVSADGDIFVCDTGRHRIVKIPVGEGTVEIVAGDGQRGYVDGDAHKARFNEPTGIAVSCSGDMYVADKGNHCIRKIDAHTGMVSTVAGNGKAGWRDGDASTAQFNHPFAVTIADDGWMYVSDEGNECIRKMDPVDGCVVTVAGTGIAGFCDGEGNMAQFDDPGGLTFGNDGVLYVADFMNDCIRAISLPAAEPESDLESIEKELEQKMKRKNELAQEIHDSTTSTLAAKEDLGKTKNAIIHANEELVEMHKELKAKRLHVRAVLDQRKAELHAINGEVREMENVKTQYVTELASAKAELDEARTALDVVTVEKEKYAQKIKLVNAQLRRANKKDDVEQGGHVTGEESDGGFEAAKSDEVSETTETKTDKESDEPQEVTGETPATASETAAQETRANKEGEEDPQVETSWSKEELADGKNNVADPLQRVEKETSKHVDLVGESSETSQKCCNAVRFTAHEECRALEKEVKERESRLEKSLGLGKYAVGRGAKTDENKKETVEDNN